LYIYFTPFDLPPISLSLSLSLSRPSIFFSFLFFLSPSFSVPLFDSLSQSEWHGGK
jgi:hypothetical protein